MKKPTYSGDEKHELLTKAQYALDLRNQYWDAIHDFEAALGFDIDGADEIIDQCPGEECTEEEFDSFIEACMNASETDFDECVNLGADEEAEEGDL